MLQFYDNRNKALIMVWSEQLVVVKKGNCLRCATIVLKWQIVLYLSVKMSVAITSYKADQTCVFLLRLRPLVVRLKHKGIAVQCSITNLLGNQYSENNQRDALFIQLIKN
jgi:hypothetical protein